MNINEMITQNLPLIRSVTKRYYISNNVFTFEDMVNTGVLGLLKNLQKYDPSRGKLSTFITVCVKNDLLKFLKKHNQIFSTQRLSSNLEYTVPDGASDYVDKEDDETKEIVRMKVEGYTVKEIAKIINKPSSFVYTKIRKFKRTMRKYLDV